jgi:photosystem II stability/assembly factor-like uncharacterized protein
MRFRCAFILACNLALYSILVFCYENSSLPVRFERMGPFGGDVRSLLMDAQQPGIVYLGSSSGRIFKSSDAGNTWMPLYPGLGQQPYVVGTLVQHPTERNHIYAGGWDLHSDGGGLFESKDAGSTWTRIPLPRAFSAVRGFGICRNAPERMIVGTLEGVYVSSDGGQTWRLVGGSELQKAESVAIDPIDYRFLYVGTWRLGYKSSDFGKTWMRVDKGMPLDSDIFSISISIRDPNIVYSSACSGVYRSENRAQSWKRLRILPDRFTIRARVVSVDPQNPHKVYSGTTEGLFVSGNDGRTWTRLTSKNLTVNAIQVDPANGRRILIGTEYRGILLSEDGGRSWKESNSGFIHKQISWILPDPKAAGRLVVGVLSGGGGWYLYDDHAIRWTPSQIEPGMRILSFLILPKDLGMLAGTSQGLYWQPYRSNHWTKLKGSIAKRTIYSLEVDPASPVVYAGTDRGIYRSPLKPLDFRLPPGYRLSPKAWCLNAPRAHPGLVYAGTSLGLLRSYDRGTTWNVISAYGLPDRATIGTIAVSPANKEQLFAGTSAGLFESTNGGVHWSRADGGRMAMSISSIVFLDESGNRILAADQTFGGIFYSQDGGGSWYKISSPEYESPVYCLVRDPVRPSRVYAGTRSEGVYRLELP